MGNGIKAAVVYNECRIATSVHFIVELALKNIHYSNVVSFHTRLLVIFYNNVSSCISDSFYWITFAYLSSSFSVLI